MHFLPDLFHIKYYIPAVGDIFGSIVQGRRNMNLCYIESKCPHCGSKNRATTNTWAYDSPIRTCEFCREEFLEPKFREIAVEGLDPRTTNSGFYVKGGLITFILSVLILAYQIFKFGEISLTKISILSSISFIISILCFVISIRIRLGIEQRNSEKYIQESKQRMQDKKYVEKLRKYGYRI